MPATPTDAPPENTRKVALAVLAGVALIALLGFVLGNSATRVIAVCILACAALGFFRGGMRIVGSLVGLVAAGMLAGPVGKAGEGLVNALVGTSGVIGRYLSIALAGLFLFLALGGGLAWWSRKLLKDNEPWRPWDKTSGVALGTLEGLLLGSALLWGITTIAPLLAATTLPPIISRQELATRGDRRRAADPGPRPPKPSGLRGLVLSIADDTGKSALGGLTRAVSPDTSAIMDAARDFAAISGDDEAMTKFLQSAPIQGLRDEPRLKAALDTLSRDQELATLFKDGVSTEGIAAAMRNGTVLELLDDKDLTKTLREKSADVAKALREAASGARPR
jgi:hypothetical protein